MRAKRNLCVSARFLTVYSRFLLAASQPVRFVIAGVAAGTVLSLGGCAEAPAPQRFASTNSKEYFPSSIYGAASPRVVADGEPVPRGGGIYMVGKPYSIAGRTYYPSEKNYAAIGYASWYGDAFHGRRTANGEVYDRDSISAAHPTMPLPCYARVTNLQNHYSMIVRVNDRGPFAADRIMDVSRRTAEALDFRQIGTTRVKVEYIGAASLDGSDDQMLLATLRSKGKASLAALDGRGKSAVADNTPSLIARAETQSDALAAGDEASESELAPGDGGGRSVPLPPARPSGLGKTTNVRTPIALR